MRSVFVDTSRFYALLDRTDPAHGGCASCFRRAEAEGWSLVTSNYVLHETWALIQARLGWRALDAWRDHIVPLCEIVWIDGSMHALGEARCRQARERRLGLTDCLSIEIVRRRGIREFIGEGEHLSREGFRSP